MTLDQARVELAVALDEWQNAGGDVMKVANAIATLAVLCAGGIVK